MYVYADQPTLGGYNSNAVRSGNGLGNRRSNANGWGIFEEKTTASSWLASLGLQNDRRNGLSTSKYSSFWSNFHFFEAPRRRSLSSSSNAPPSMIKFCFLCAFWYSTSALSNNTGKAILNQFRYPITLTFVQFGFIAAYCLLFTSPLIRFTRLRRPTKAILESTLPMGLFQVGGHVFSSVAISRIPVSTVHTIKALSPLFTVAAYAMLFGVKYSAKTYFSLLPLTVGVMLACSFDMSASNALGLLSAFASAIVFVSSNIFFKKVMPSGSSQASSHKLDKLNLLMYSSSMAFMLMIPMWMYYDLPTFLSASERTSHPTHGKSSGHSILFYFFLNGTVHFAQNIIAFIILSSTSPVTYSIASLFKRVAVICMAIVWFNQTVHVAQGLGICLTFVGLWMYNNAKGDVEKGENKMRRVEAARDLVLPSTREEHRMMHSDNSPALSDNEQEPISISSGVERGAYTSPLTSHPPNATHSQHHGYPNPNLKIKITPEKHNTGFLPTTATPKDSYPSPPLSHESPPTPPSELPSVSPHVEKSRRRGTVSRPNFNPGHVPGQIAVTA